MRRPSLSLGALVADLVSAAPNASQESPTMTTPRPMSRVQKLRAARLAASAARRAPFNLAPVLYDAEGKRLRGTPLRMPERADLAPMGLRLTIPRNLARAAIGLRRPVRASERALVAELDLRAALRLGEHMHAAETSAV